MIQRSLFLFLLSVPLFLLACVDVLLDGVLRIVGTAWVHTIRAREGLRRVLKKI